MFSESRNAYYWLHFGQKPIPPRFPEFNHGGIRRVFPDTLLQKVWRKSGIGLDVISSIEKMLWKEEVKDGEGSRRKVGYSMKSHYFNTRKYA